MSLHTHIPQRLFHRACVLCVEQDRLLQDFVAEALRAYLHARRRR